MPGVRRLAPGDRNMLIRFHPLGKCAEARPDETVLDAARRVGVPIANACGGVGVCNRCNVRPVEGAENLKPMTSLEQQLAGKGELREGERLACQSIVTGDCVVTTTYWGGATSREQ